MSRQDILKETITRTDAEIASQKELLAEAEAALAEAHAAFESAQARYRAVAEQVEALGRARDQFRAMLEES